MKTTKELIADLETLIRRRDHLLSQAEAMEQALEVTRKQLQELDCRWGTGGEIQKLEREIKQSAAIDRDADLPRVVWRGAIVGASEYVVSRVTPKRIYVRLVGSDKETMYERNGNPVGYFSAYAKTIDIKRTFPNGIDKFGK